MKDLSQFSMILMAVFGALTLAGVLCFAGYLPGCGATGGGGGGGIVRDYGTVTVWGTLDDAVVSPALRDIRAGVVKSNGRIVINYRRIRLEDLQMRLLDAIASRQAPDIIIAPHSEVHRFKKYIEPIPFSERKYRDTFAQAAEIYYDQDTDTTVAFPLALDPMVMYWNRDIFSSNAVGKVPLVWEEFYTLIPRLTIRTGAEIQKSGVAMGEYANVTNAKGLLSALFMQAGAAIAVNGNVQINSPSTLEAIDFYLGFANPTQPQYTWNRQLPESNSMFARGDLAMYFGYASEIANLRRLNPHLNSDVADIPQARGSTVKVTHANVIGASLLADARNTRGGAQYVLSNLAGAQSGKTLASGLGIVPARLDLLSTDPDDIYFSVFYRAGLYARTWNDPDRQRSDDVFREAIEGILSGQFTREGALEHMSEGIRSLF